MLGLVLSSEARCAEAANLLGMISISAVAKKPSRKCPDPGHIACTVAGAKANGLQLGRHTDRLDIVARDYQRSPRR